MLKGRERYDKTDLDLSTLWKLVISKILFKLNERGTKVIAYEDDIVLLIKKISFYNKRTHGIGTWYSNRILIIIYGEI